LSNLSASNLTSGTIPNDRYGTPTFNGSNLTNTSVASSTGSWSLTHSVVNLSVNSARYVKVGRICHVAAYGRNTSTTSGGAGPVYFRGLPFTSWNSGNIVGGGTISYKHRFGSYYGFNIIIFPNTTHLHLRGHGAEYDLSNVSSTELAQQEDFINNNKYFTFEATYITAS
jgi:hypothetical protein